LFFKATKAIVFIYGHFIVVLALQKFLQFIKYSILEFTPSPNLLYLLPPIPGIMHLVYKPKNEGVGEGGMRVKLF
jgi:hypothetical protein